MTATVCTCIRHERDARLVAVPDPDCGQHRHHHAHGNKPTLVIYDETAQADQDALRAAAGLGRLLRWTARLLLAAVLLWIFATDTAAMTGWHWAAGIAATPLALIAMPVPKEKP